MSQISSAEAEPNLRIQEVKKRKHPEPEYLQGIYEQHSQAIDANLASLHPYMGYLDIDKMTADGLFDGIEEYTGRGRSVSLLGGGLPEALGGLYLPKAIVATGGRKGPLWSQFIADQEAEKAGGLDFVSDPLSEDAHLVAPGVTLKYGPQDNEGRHYAGRALLTFEYNCAAYCRFCTRGRHVGASGTMPFEQIKAGLDYIQAHPDIDEVILSGGDALMMKPQMLTYVIDRLSDLQKRDQLASVRIGTRLPVHNPGLISERHYAEIARLRDPKIMLHVNHAWEITKQTHDVVSKFRSLGAVVRSQSVMLRGVNDNTEDMYNLLRKVDHAGIVPYYVYFCDRVSWGTQFMPSVDDFERISVDIKRLSPGVVSAVDFVIDDDAKHVAGKSPRYEEVAERMRHLR